MSSLWFNSCLKVLASKTELSKENSKIYLFANNMALRPHDFNAKTIRLLRSARSVYPRTASLLCVNTAFKLKPSFNLTIIKFTLDKKPQLVRRHDNMLSAEVCQCDPVVWYTTGSHITHEYSRISLSWALNPFDISCVLVPQSKL